MTDPIVEEVRRIREEHAAQFGFDIDAIFEDIIKQQEKSGRIFVNYPPRLVEPLVPVELTESIEITPVSRTN